MATQMNCSECPLNSTKGILEVPIFYAGQRAGKTTCREVKYTTELRKDKRDLLFVGDAPNAHDLEAGVIMSGDLGKLIAAELKSNNYPVAQSGAVAACRCHLHKDIKGQKKEIKKALDACRPALVEEIKKHNPKLLVLFGDNALRQIMKQSGITKKRGVFQWSKEFECWVLPTFSPAACLMDQGKFAFWRPDMSRAIQFFRNGCQPPAITNAESIYRDVESIDFILEQEKITVGLDTETQGKEWANPNSVVISYSISDKVGGGYNIWLAWEVEEGEQDTYIQWPRKVGKETVMVNVPIKYAPDYDRKIEELRELCQRPDIKIVMMNGVYDLHRLRTMGIQRDEVKGYTLDIQSAAHALDPDTFKMASMKDIQTAFLPDKPDHKAVLSKDEKGDMLGAAKRDPIKHSQYACADTDRTLELGFILRERLLRDKRLAHYYVNVVQPIQTEVLYDIEKNGILFDLQKLPEVKAQTAQVIRQTENALFELVPPAVIAAHAKAGLRLTRGALLRDIFFSKKGFGLKPKEKTPTGDPSTGRKGLIRLRDELPDGNAKEALSLLIEWGPYQKLYSTYLKGLEKAVFPDGKFHTIISKTGTGTGRTNSIRPNLQNIPKRNPMIKNLIRNLMLASPGKVFCAFDFSQAELRWIAHDSQDAEFLRVFRNGEDLHLNTAKAIIKRRGMDPTGMSKADLKPFRQSAKAVNFGLSYGMFAKGFQAYARDEYGVKMSLEEAEDFRYMYLHELYPGLPAWHDRRIAEARATGMVRSPFGAIRRFPNILSDDFGKRSSEERQAVNTAIQSVSNDSTLLAGLLAKRQGLVDDNHIKLVLFIHDELIFEVDEDMVDWFIPRMLDIMQNLPLRQMFGFDLAVPLIADAQVGRTLADLHDYEPGETLNVAA